MLKLCHFFKSKAKQWLGGVVSQADQFTTAAALKRVRRRDLTVGTVIDIGASDGRWSAAAKQVYPDANYFLVEAQAAHGPGLEDFVKKNPRAQYVVAAAGNSDKEIYFDDADLFGGVASVVLRPGMKKIPSITVDREIEKRKLPPPYLIKLDTHGFEVPILEGCAKTLQSTALLVIETYNFRIADGALLFHEMCHYMQGKGFRVIDISEPLWRDRDQAFWQIDLFFVRSDRAEFLCNTYR